MDNLKKEKLKQIINALEEEGLILDNETKDIIKKFDNDDISLEEMLITIKTIFNDK